MKCLKHDSPENYGNGYQQQQEKGIEIKCHGSRDCTTLSSGGHQITDHKDLSCGDVDL